MYDLASPKWYIKTAKRPKDRSDVWACAFFSGNKEYSEWFSGFLLGDCLNSNLSLLVLRERLEFKEWFLISFDEGASRNVFWKKRKPKCQADLFVSCLSKRLNKPQCQFDVFTPDWNGFKPSQAERECVCVSLNSWKCRPLATPQIH